MPLQVGAATGPRLVLSRQWHQQGHREERMAGGTPRGSGAHRRRALQGGLPLLLLLTALATLFPAFVDSGPLHEPRRSHHHVTFNHLTVAKNMAAEHAWLGFYRQTVDDDGQPAYEVYNRFPPLGYLLIKLATLTQRGDLAGEIQAARMLMLALYAAAAVLAYLALAALTGRRYAALAATLAAFSSYALMHACDMVATEGTVDLFGTMLAFHGIARYQRGAAAGRAAGEPPFGQLVVKAGAALLLGWHVLALLGPFVALGLAAAATARDGAECRRLAAFGAFALLFAFAVLAYNFARDYFALGEAAVGELPALESMRKRSLWGAALGEPLSSPMTLRTWAWLGGDQLHRVGLALAPYLASGTDIGWWGWKALGALGIAGVAAAAAAALARRQAAAARSACLALLPLATAGLLWAVVMPGTVRAIRLPCPACWSPEHWHNFEAMFHVGIPLALVGLLALVPNAAAWQRRAPRLIAATLVATLWLVFAGSTSASAQRHRDTDLSHSRRTLLADLDAIRRLTTHKRVFVPGQIWSNSFKTRQSKRFFFAGRVLIVRAARARFADVVTGPRIPGARTLTPNNLLYFLYPMHEYSRLCEGATAQSTPQVLQRWCKKGKGGTGLLTDHRPR